MRSTAVVRSRVQTDRPAPGLRRTLWLAVDAAAESTSADSDAWSPTQLGALSRSGSTARPVSPVVSPPWEGDIRQSEQKGAFFYISYRGIARKIKEKEEKRNKNKTKTTKQQKQQKQQKQNQKQNQTELATS